MHQVSSPADLDIAFDRRGSKSVEQPSSVLIAAESIPFAANDRDRRLHECRIIGELAVLGVQNVGERPGRNFHSGRFSTSTL